MTELLTPEKPTAARIDIGQVVDSGEAECSSVVGHTIVVGSGPVGMRFVEDLLHRRPLSRVQVFGNEPFHPYNRVQLSALLAGEIKREAMDIPLPEAERHPNFSYTVSTIRSIDPDAKTVTDADGVAHYFTNLVIATGARAHVPNIPGVDKTGVYTFRNLKDAESLYARVARSRHAVVVGGGLLGIEAARGLLRLNTQVTLVQQAARLMNRQLDDPAAERLKAKVEALGIRVITSSGVRQIYGETRVTGVKTYSGEGISCDTVLLCAGIKPNVELARNAGLDAATGIVVSDQLQTSSPGIYAIGECCEHRGLTYGLVNPGFEQAAVAAEVISLGQASYVGSLSVSRLKVIGQSVCSMGEVADLAKRPLQSELVYKDDGQELYRKVVTLKGRIIGAVGFGEWPELNRVQEAFRHQRPIRFWQAPLFRLTGRLWAASDSDDVAKWPANAIVCQCNGISQGQLIRAIDSGFSSVTQLQECTGAGTVCGSCKPLLAQLAGNTGPRDKERGWLPVLAGSVVALLLALLVVLSPEAEVAQSFQAIAWFEMIWNDKYWKQVTGFSLLGLSALGLVMSLRKRAGLTWMGNFANWRVLHTSLGVACAAVLIFHTGFHLGSNLNQLLMLDFLAVLVMGASAGSVVALSHRLRPQKEQSIRKLWTWFHVLVTWPLPALLGIHILTVYYY